MTTLVVALVLMQASALLGVVGYIYNDAKKRDKQRKKDIEGLSKDIRNIDSRLDNLEANLFGHEKGSEGYITMTQDEINRIHTKLDSIQDQMDSDSEETRKLLSEVIAWIEKEDDNGHFDPDVDRTLDLEDD